MGGLIETAIDVAVPEAALPLRVLGWAKGAGAYLFAHPMFAVALLAGVFGAVEHHEATKWATVAQHDQAALSALKTANAQAIKSATQAKELKDAQNVHIAAVADQSAVDLDGRYRAIVMQRATTQSAARRTDLPGDANPAQGGAGPGASADVPANIGTVSTADALICADNTARLQAVHDWAVALGQ